jgi:hypothetical protein
MKTFKIFKDLNKIDSPNSEYYTVKFKIKGNPIDAPRYTKSGDYFILKAWLNQDTWKESIKSVYDPLIQGSVLENISKILTMSGMGSLKSKYTARKVWKDIESMTFPLSVYFQAESSAYRDVEAPIRNLESLVVPSEYIYSGSNDKSEESLFLLPPGEPYITSDTIKTAFEEAIEIVNKVTGVNAKKFLPVGGKNPRILKEVEIGKFIKLRNIILESIDVEWYMNDPDPSGVPLSAKVDLGLITIDLWTLKTILRLLQKHDDGDEFKSIKIEDAIKSAGMNLSEVLKTIKGGGKK